MTTSDSSAKLPTAGSDGTTRHSDQADNEACPHNGLIDQMMPGLRWTGSRICRFCGHSPFATAQECYDHEWRKHAEPMHPEPLTTSYQTGWFRTSSGSLDYRIPENAADRDMSSDGRSRVMSGAERTELREVVRKAIRSVKHETLKAEGYVDSITDAVLSVLPGPDAEDAAAIRRVGVSMEAASAYARFPDADHFDALMDALSIVTDDDVARLARMGQG